MYRAVTWWMRGKGVDTDDSAAVAARIREPVIQVGTDPRAPTITIDGVTVNITDPRSPIRTPEVDSAVSAVARVPEEGVSEVRAHLISLQQQIIASARAEARGIVVDGRDIGTVVARDAPVKFYLTAADVVRGHRRGEDQAADPTVTQAALALRDQRDARQSERAADAIVIDTTGRDLDEVVSEVIAIVQERAGRAWTA
jgi:cytidylate kinase